MTTWRVSLSSRAVKQLARIHTPDQRRIAGAIELLHTNPFPPACRKLSGRAAWWIRVGTYRIIYTVNQAEITIVVIRIARRKDADRL